MSRIRISHGNLRAALGKKVELVDFLESNNVDVMSVNETWFKPNKAFSIPNYHVVRLDRNSLVKERGGGVCILVKSAIAFTEIVEPSTFDSQEFLAIRLKGFYKDPQMELVVATYYNPPGYGTVSKDLLDWASRLGPRVILLGDFNAHHPSLLSDRLDQNGGTIFDFLEESNFVLLNDDSPNYLGRAGQTSILDLAMISPALAGDFIEFRVEFSLSSDHLPLTVDLKCERSAPTKKTVEVSK